MHALVWLVTAHRVVGLRARVVECEWVPGNSVAQVSMLAALEDEEPETCSCVGQSKR